MGRPELLMLDEPSLGLAPRLAAGMMDSLAQMHQQGLTLLLVEQNANAAMHKANRGYVLQSGHVVLQGSAETLRADPGLQQTYLGGSS
jgi:branched-chain amino acid transport system ATP-binding protein